MLPLLRTTAFRTIPRRLPPLPKPYSPLHLRTAATKASTAKSPSGKTKEKVKQEDEAAEDLNAESKEGPANEEQRQAINKKGQASSLRTEQAQASKERGDKLADQIRDLKGQSNEAQKEPTSSGSKSVVSKIPTKTKQEDGELLEDQGRGGNEVAGKGDRKDANRRSQASSLKTEQTQASKERGDELADQIRDLKGQKGGSQDEHTGVGNAPHPSASRTPTKTPSSGSSPEGTKPASLRAEQVQASQERGDGLANQIRDLRKKNEAEESDTGSKAPSSSHAGASRATSLHEKKPVEEEHLGIDPAVAKFAEEEGSTDYGKEMETLIKQTAANSTVPPPTTTTSGQRSSSASNTTDHHGHHPYPHHVSASSSNIGTPRGPLNTAPPPPPHASGTGKKEGKYKADRLFNIAGYNCVVTNGASGLGLTLARGLAQNGARVFITGRNDSGELEKAAMEFSRKEGAGGEIVALPCDLTKDALLTLTENLASLSPSGINLLINTPFPAPPASSIPPASSNTAAPPSIPSYALPLWNSSPIDWLTTFSHAAAEIWFTTVSLLPLLKKTQVGCVLNILPPPSHSGQGQGKYEQIATETAKESFGERMRKEFQERSGVVVLAMEMGGVKSEEERGREAVVALALAAVRVGSGGGEWTLMGTGRGDEKLR